MNFLIGLGQVFLIIIGIFILGIVINLIMKRGVGTTIGASMMPSQKTLVNSAWILGTYVICLWAFSLIWPNAWDAWWNSKGFWVTQLLFISAIGFISSEWMKTKRLRWLSLIPVAMAMLLTTTTIVKNWPESKDAPIAKISDKPAVKTPRIPPQPPITDTTFTLKAGDTTVRYKSYDGWVLATGATGRYQHQVDDGPWLIRGDGSDEKNLQGGAVRLTSVDSAIRVRVVYRQIN